jgi:PAS domain S-box-containing protein
MAKILIIDDRATDRLLLVTLLGYHGHTLLEAVNGEEGLARAKAERPDLVICDLLMPRMDGYQFLRLLREDPAVGATPVLFYSATYDGPQAQALASSAGITSILLKASDPEVILQKVNEALGTARPAPAPLSEEFDRQHAALLNEKLFEKAAELETSNRRLAALLDVGTRLAAEHHPARLAEHVCAVARDILGPAAAAVCLLAADRRSPRHFCGLGLPAEVERALAHSGPRAGLLGALLDDRRPRRLQGAPAAEPFGPGVRTLLAVPIASPAAAHGWLVALNKLGAAEFSPEDEQVARTLAAQVAVSYENALRYERIEQQAAALRAEVAERRRAEEEVRRQREWLAVTLSSIGDAVIATDNAGRVLFMNPVAEKLTGWRQPDAAGAPLERVFRILNEGTRATVESPVEKVLREGTVQGLANHTVLVAQDGTERPIDDCAAPIRDQSGTHGVVLIFHDVTGQRELERQLRERAEKLAEADRRKTEFLTMLAHELRNPLAPIRNALHVLQLRGDDRAILEQVRGMMGRQVEHMARMIDDLLEVSRLTRGRVALREQPLDLATLVRQVGEDHRGPLESVGLELRVHLPAAPVWVRGDPARLSQVLGNLLDNARKFSPRGARVDLRLAAEAAGAVVAVADTGVGIAPEDLPHLFEPFTQGDQGLARSTGGLGLGLAMAKGLVELHGGTVEAHSAGQGQGATFTVRLPRQPGGAEAPAPGPAPAPPAGQPPRVLVVEDGRDAAESLRMLLELLGHEVRVAPTGAAGLEEARRWRPDVVVCDLGLPGMDGFKVAQALRQAPETARLRLVALTGYGQEQDQRKALAAGFDAYLVKPADTEKLLRVIAGAPAG